MIDSGYLGQLATKSHLALASDFNQNNFTVIKLAYGETQSSFQDRRVQLKKLKKIGDNNE